MVGGRDGYLEKVMNYELFDAFNKFNGEQKVTHMGWELNMHLREALLQLETDDIVVQSMQKTHVRLALRMAVLFHDVGKLMDIYTPGAHEVKDFLFLCTVCREQYSVTISRM